MIIIDIDQLKKLINEEKIKNKKIVRTNGCFDLLHPGHIQTFKKAKDMGDILIVGLNGDTSPYRKTKPGRPINDVHHRSVMLASIKYIDYVYIFEEETPIIPIQAILPDVLVKGGDYQVEHIAGYKEVFDNGGEIVTIPTVEGYSTTNIVNKIKYQ